VTQLWPQPLTPPFAPHPLQALFKAGQLSEAARAAAKAQADAEPSQQRMVTPTIPQGLVLDNFEFCVCVYDAELIVHCMW
jgi:hypothetical protein